MPTPKEEALETLSALKADFDAVAEDARADQKQFRLLQRFGDPKGREEEFAGYAQQAVAASEAISKDDKPGATAQLQGMKAVFDKVATDCRAQATGILESFFHLYELEAQKFEGYSASVDKVMKLSA